MPPTSELIVFAVASLLLALAPGPDLLYVITRGAAQGRAAGVIAAAGLCTGVIGHTLLCIVGLSAVIAASPNAFLVLKVAGAAYLGYLAIRMWGGRGALADTAANVENVRLGVIFRQSVIMNLINPKVALFFFAFLPQFVDPAAGSNAAQFAILGAIFLVCGFVVMAPAGVAAGYLRWRLVGSPRAGRVIRLVAGAVFFGLGVRLIVADFV